jgi:hypothetical protein
MKKVRGRREALEKVERAKTTPAHSGGFTWIILGVANVQVQNIGPMRDYWCLRLHEPFLNPDWKMEGSSHP